MSSQELTIKQYWHIVGQIPCLISGNPKTTFHHCHGGSMVDIGMKGQRGTSQKPSDWLIIPIAAEYHYLEKGVDTGCMTVREWESKYGRQVDYLNELIQLTGVDIWEKIKEDSNKY